MKRGRDDEKVMGPLFPRLHVNDTEKKGGPRAPPRNKMALYEQLSVPSQRSGSGIVPIKSNSSTNLVPAGSSSQRSILERNVRFPSHVPPHMPNQLAEMLHSCQHDGGNMNTSLPQLKQRKKVHDEDDFRVPVFVHSGMGQNNAKTQSDIDEKIIPLHTTHSGSSMNDDNVPKAVSTTSPSLRQDLVNQSDENLEARVLDGDHQSFISFQSRGKIARIEEVVNASPKQCDGDHSAVNESNTCLQQEPTNDKCSDEGIPKLKRRREKGNAWLQRSDFCSGEVHSSPNEPEIDSECQVDKTCGSVQVGNGDNSNASETSMVDSVSALAISPDEVVGIIGQKHFWKARKAIVNQQRVFAIQVFELHRLIKVQQLIAGSPHLLLEDNTYPEKPSAKGSTPNNVPLDCVVNAPTHAANRKDDSEKSNHRMECSAENAVGKTSLSLVKNGSQPPSYGPYLGNPIPVPTASDPKMGPWYFHQSFGQQQWLVPVMSPSEGLIYKPYTPPGFGGCGPIGPPLFACNFVNPAYGFPAPHPHQGIGVPPGAPPVGHGYYLPSYGMPVMSPSISGSAVEQMNRFAGSGSHSQLGQASGDGVKFNTQHQSSDNAVNQKGGAIPQSKDMELQGSTGSSPCETAKGVGMVQDADRRDPLRVRPMVPTPPGGNPQFQETDHPTRVIRVVPHNPRSATESAVRIFQSIQAEKRQLDSL